MENKSISWEVPLLLFDLGTADNCLSYCDIEVDRGRACVAPPAFYRADTGCSAVFWWMSLQGRIMWFSRLFSKVFIPCSKKENATHSSDYVSGEDDFLQISIRGSLLAGRN